ncbi:MAG: AhpC/TSA family protein [candidate division Zixibacteria bacterium]|nr:AhpC/TSA family protein [candidate division Zixibacteria bacterium]
MQAELAAIEAAGGTLVAISPEPPDTTLSTVEKHNLQFAVLSDDALDVARAFGLSYELPPALDSLYRSFGLDLKTRNGTASSTLPIPATYVVDRDGRVVFAHVDIDYTTRSEPSDIVATLQSIR